MQPKAVLLSKQAASGAGAFAARRAGRVGRMTTETQS